MSLIIRDPKHLPLTLSNATSTSDGVMSAADKVKLDGIGPGGGTLSSVYANSLVPANSTMLLTAAGGGVRIWDNAVPLAVPLFEVASAAGTTPYLRVSSSGGNPSLAIQNSTGVALIVTVTGTFPVDSQVSIASATGALVIDGGGIYIGVNSGGVPISIGAPTASLEFFGGGGSVQQSVSGAVVGAGNRDAIITAIRSALSAYALIALT